MTSPNLSHWPAWLRDELAAASGNGCVGQVLVSENERVRVWSLALQPGERIGFHTHVLDYFWTVVTDGQARSHYSDGRTEEPAYRAGDTKHLRFEKGQSMIHDLENIGTTPLIFTTVEFLDSANEALKIPDHIRRATA